MADFSTSNVAATVGQGVNQFNPLQTIQGVATTQNLLNQNRLFQAQQAQGRLVQQAIDPATGTYNQNAFLTGLANAGPGAAIGAADAAQAGATLQHSGIANQTAAQALAAAQWGKMLDIMGSMAGSPSLNKGALSSVIQSAVAAGVIPQGVASTGLAQLPDDADSLRTALQGPQLAALGTQGAMAATQPSPTAISSGGATNFERLPNIGAPTSVGTPIVNTPAPSTITIDDGAGTHVLAVTPSQGTATPVGGVIPRQLSPSERIQRVPTIVNGVPTTVSAGAISTPTGAPLSVPGLTGPHGEMTANYTPQQQAAGQAAGAQVGQQAGGQFASYQNAAAAAPMQIANLNDLESILNRPGFSTGPASNFTSELNALASEFGVKLPDTQNQSAINVFRKIAEQIAQTQFQGLTGTGSDAKLSSAQHTSPDNLISTLGNEEIIPLLKGNAAGSKVVASAANQWLSTHGNDPTTAPQFQQWLNQHYNPLVFQSQFMSPSQRASTVNGLAPADRTQYHQDYIYALKHGWITQ